jgi:general secretion pathway protein G
MSDQNKTLKPGFSFLEIMIVITIIGIFLAVAGPRLMSLLGKGYKTATQSTLNSVAAGIMQYKADVGQYPVKLEDLVKRPESITGWDGPYVGSEKTAEPEVPRDSWGQELRYEKLPGNTPPYKLWSLGDPDKEDAPIYAK